MNAIQSLIECGTKLYLDSVDPEEVTKNLAWGAVGATSNPVIISEIIERGLLDREIETLVESGLDDVEISWRLTDHLVRSAQERFLHIWKRSEGNAGWVSFELDPILEDPQESIAAADRTDRYLTLGKHWSEGHQNRMIKVPATDAGIAALEELAAAGITLNVTLIFTEDQYQRARDAIWRGAQRRPSLADFKSVYSIFVSRIDVYTDEEVPELGEVAQGQVGIVNAKQIWVQNQAFWKDKPTRLQQEIVFASTGTKKPEDKPWKYVEALAGSDIQTNPPKTNQAVADSGLTFRRQVDQVPDPAVIQEIRDKVDFHKMRNVLIQQGIEKFVKPQRTLIRLVRDKRLALTGG